MKPICGSSGTSMYIASAQQERSTMPMTICSSVSGPPGSVHLPVAAADDARRAPHPGDIAAPARSGAQTPSARLNQGGSWSIALAACG